MGEYGDVYRRLRKKANKSIPTVLKELNNMGIKLTASALYNYENNTRAASADILLALCQIYDCHNIMEEFANVKPDYSIPSEDEWNIIKKFRALDERGRNNVLDTLEREFSYTEEAKKGRKDEDLA